MSRADVGFALARCYGLSPDPIEVGKLADHPRASIMPRDTSYGASRLPQMIRGLSVLPLEDEFLQDARANQQP